MYIFSSHMAVILIDEDYEHISYKIGYFMSMIRISYLICDLIKI